MNYIMWRLAATRVGALSVRFRDVRQKVYEVFYGIPETPPRYRTCVGVVNGAMVFASGRLYVDKHFSGDSKANVRSYDVMFVSRVNKKWTKVILHHCAIQVTAVSGTI